LHQKLGRKTDTEHTWTKTGKMRILGARLTYVP